MYTHFVSWIPSHGFRVLSTVTTDSHTIPVFATVREQLGDDYRTGEYLGCVAENGAWLGATAYPAESES